MADSAIACHPVHPGAALDLPVVGVQFNDLQHDVKVPVSDVRQPSEGAPGVREPSDTPTRWGSVGKTWRAGAWNVVSRSTTTVNVLNVCCGTLHPGRSVLLLGNPGSGTSTFLRLLSGRQAPSSGPHSILYNGCTAQDMEAAGVAMSKLASYCGETDDHEALLSVRETLAFTYTAAVARPPAAGLTVAHGEGSATYTPPDAEAMIQAMGLQEAADTKIGSALVRGVSGGQKRRVTVAEALLTNARIVCLDQPTNGLDSATAVNVMRFACEWARSTSGILVAALQQPGPDLVRLFDDVILLSDGYVVYHGPRLGGRHGDGGAGAGVNQPGDGMEGYLAGLGLVRPGYTDMADWAAEVLSDPSNAAQQVLSQLHKLEGDRAHARTLGDAEEERRATEELQRMQQYPNPDLAHMNPSGLGAMWQVEQKRRASRAQAIPHAPDPDRTGAMLADTEQQVAAESAGTGTQEAQIAVVEDSTPAGRTRADSQTPFLAPSPGYPMSAPVTMPARGGVQMANSGRPSPDVMASFFPTAYARRQYGMDPVLTLWQQLLLLFRRQFTLSFRNTLYILLRLVNCALMGAILGLVYINIPRDNFILKLSLALFALCFIAFINNAEIPLAMSSRSVAYKQTGAGLYSERQYTLALMAAHVPLTLVSDFVFATVLYWMTGWVAVVPRWLFFCLIIFSLDLAVSVMFRSFSFWSPNQELAMTVATAFVAVGLATGGFFVTRFQLPIWLIWLLYISPFFWGVTSIANNEFLDPAYSAPLPGVAGGASRGETFLRTFDFPYGTWWKLGGLLFLLGLYLLVGFLVQPYVLKHVRRDIVPGTRRAAVGATKSVGEKAQLAVLPSASGRVPSASPAPMPVSAQDATVEVASVHGQGPGEPSGEAQCEVTGRNAAPTLGHTTNPSPPQAVGFLPFPSVTLAFRDVQYSVPAAHPATAKEEEERGGGTKGTPLQSKAAATSDQGENRKDEQAVHTGGVYGASPDVHASGKQLLCGVSGFARPGTLTALMGASGAGKTTLLDVLAFRKTTGAVSGRINLNSLPATGTLMSQVSGYCEQEDVHLGEYSVRESLMFAAQLKLDPAVTHDRKVAFVENILEMLELKGIAGRRVQSLARGERKRVSVGVSLAGNPPLVYLDEPTTGLDARSAALLVSVLRRVADTGRTVICTIHQPSATVLFAFSHLLLLAPGGNEVYMGPLGAQAACLVAFLEGIPGVPAIPKGTNPADWMMTVLEGKQGGPAVEAEQGVDVGTGQQPAAGAGAGAGAGSGIEQASSDTGEATGTSHKNTVARRQALARQHASSFGLAPEPHTGAQYAAYYRYTKLHERMQHCLGGLLDEGEAQQQKQDAGVNAATAPASANLPTTAFPPTPSTTTAPSTPSSSSVSRFPAPCDLELVTLITPSLQAKAKDVMQDFSRPAQLPDIGARCDALSVPLGDQDVSRIRRPSWLVRFRVVLTRQAQAYARAPAVVVVRPIMMVILAVFFGLCYLSLDYATFAGTFSAFGAMLAGSGFVGVLLYTTVVPLAFGYRAVFYRERAAGLVSPGHFTLAILLVEIPIVTLCVLIFSPIFFYLVGWPKQGVSHLLWYGLLTWFTAMCYTIGGWAAAFLLPSTIIAQVVGGFFLAISFLFGCVFVPPAFVPAGWRWFVELDFAAWATKGTAADLFYCAGGAAAGCPTIPIITPAGPASVDTSSYLLGTLLEFPHSQMGLAVPYMLANLVGFAIAFALAVKYVSHQKR